MIRKIKPINSYLTSKESGDISLKYQQDMLYLGSCHGLSSLDPLLQLPEKNWAQLS